MKYLKVRTSFGLHLLKFFPNTDPDSDLNQIRQEQNVIAM